MTEKDCLLGLPDVETADPRAQRALSSSLGSASFVPPRDSPLVVVDTVCYLDAYAELGILQPRPLRLRAAVAERLAQADDTLPARTTLCVLDGHRSQQDQQYLLDYYSDGVTDLTGYVASTDDDELPPPHTTGGALDITLAVGGRPLALGTDFDAFGPRSHALALESEADSVACGLRRLLHHCLVDVGFAPYAMEWWHFSLGDWVWGLTFDEPPVFGRVEV